MVEEAHPVGIKILGITGNAKNAFGMAKSSAGPPVALGDDGRGHTGRVGNIALQLQAIDAAAPVPVSAAGGIGEGNGLDAALAGLCGSRVGTGFLETNEGGALELNKQPILDSTDEDIRVSMAHSGKTLQASLNEFHALWDSRT